MELEIPGYEVKSVIGHGGMAEVYLARHIRLDREVALKVLLDRYASDPSFGERFIREARIAANLAHQNVVQIYDVNRHDSKLFLAMEYVKGGDLSEKIRASHDKASIIKVVQDLCEALDYAHARGYIHRDVKPANILFRENGSLALSDFGIARAIHSDVNMTQTGMVVGTPSYMSPEQAQGLTLSGKADLYSVAVIAYQLVTGELPYQADSSISIAIKHISDPIPTLPDQLDVLQPFFDKALAKAPEDRFESGEQMSLAFAEYLEKIDKTLPFRADIATTLVSSPSIDTELDGDKTLPLAEGKELVTSDKHNSIQEGAKMGAGEAMQHHSNIQLVFMQINKFKVFITQPQTKPLLTAVVAMLVVCVAGILAVQLGAFGKNQELSPGQQARIGQLLQGADQDFIEGKFVSPNGSNAYEKYLAILAMSPDDVVAVEGIGRIANELESQFNAALAAENPASASQLLTAIKEIKPNNVVSVEELQSRLDNYEKAKVERVALLLQSAQAARRKNEYTTAVEAYKQVLQVEPESSLAVQGLRDITQDQIDRAEQSKSQKEFNQAASALKIAAISSNAIGDKSLQVKVASAAEKLQVDKSQDLRDQSVAELLVKGSAALSKGRLDQPRENNARHYYLEALKLDSSNSRAKQGLADVYDAMEVQISESLSADQVNNAEQLINRLAAIDSNNPAIRTFRSQLKIKKQELQRKQANDKKIEALYQRANTYLKSNRARSADKIHMQISRLAPSDSGLKQLGVRIADAYVVLAQREIDAQDWEDVDVWVQKGLVHVPNHKKLKEMSAFAATKISR